MNSNHIKISATKEISKITRIKYEALRRFSGKQAKFLYFILAILIGTIIYSFNAQGLSTTVPNSVVLTNLANGQATQLNGFSVTADNSASDILLVSIQLSDGSSNDKLRLCNSASCTPSGLTASYGYASGSNTFNSFRRISFTGNQTDINSALSGSFFFVASGSAEASVPKIKLTALLNQAGVAFFSTNNHFYKVGHYMSSAGNNLGSSSSDSGYFCSTSNTEATNYVTNYASIQSLTRVNQGSSNCTWSEANRLARQSTFHGQSGYLSNITDSEENTFLRENLSGALNVWIGGTDGASNGAPSKTEATGFNYMSNTNLGTTYSGGTEGLWHWYDGPEAGQIFWRFKGNSSITPISSHSAWQSYRSSYETTGHNTGSENSNSTSVTTNHDSVGYTNWDWTSGGAHEPNNSSSPFTLSGSYGTHGEDNIVFNWGSANGTWNDLHGNEPTINYFGYVIEYGDGTESGGFSDIASDTVNLTIGQTISGFTGASSSYSTQNVSLTAGSSIVSGTSVSTGLVITYTSTNSSVCTVGTVSNGSLPVTLVSRGTCAITASQSGSAPYQAATSVTQTFTSNFGTGASGLITDCAGIGSLENGSFETPNIGNTFLIRNDASVSTDPDRVSWLTTASDHQLEFWRSGFQDVPSGAGNQFAELNANQFAGLYQDITTVPGTVIRWSLQHRGRSGTESIRVLIGTNTGSTTYASSTGATYSVPGTFTSTTGESATKAGTTTNNVEDGTTAWGTWTGSYTVPSGQQTTRFLFISFSPGASNNSSGNFLDNIQFTPTLACPDRTTIVANRSASAFSPIANDFRPNSGNTLTVVSITGSGEATVSGTDLQLSSTTAGSYTVRYRLTNEFGDTSEANVTVTVLSESTPRLPDVLLVDPRLNRVDFPQAIFENATNLLVCVQESDSGGAILNSPTVSFDVASKGATDTTGIGSATVSGDRTSTLLIRHTRQNVLDTFNSFGGLRAYLSSGNFTSTKYVRVRTLPVETSSTSITSSTCAEAASAASKTIEIRPLELSNVLRKGTIQLK